MNNNIIYPNAANINSSTEFPYFVRTAKNHVFSDGDVDFGVFHWHEDLQFIYVIEGYACVKTLDNEVILSSGEGVFVNKKVIHYSISKSNPCNYKLFRFPEKFLSFYPGSPAEALTHAFTSNPNITLVPLFKSSDWCSEPLKILKNLVILEDFNQDDPLYSVKVLTSICQLWLNLLSNIDAPKKISGNIARMRIGSILEFIENNYSYEITLDDIAASANISKSEALRCFHSILNTSPYRYLMDFRLSKAADMLVETNMSVSDISSLTGFHQQSYFGKCFKEKTGKTPVQYRKSKK